MTPLTNALSDTSTMTGRKLRHTLRDPFSVFMFAGTPLLMLLLMNYVFGGAIAGGITLPAGTRFIDFLLPGVLALAAAEALMATAIGVQTDLSQGVISRFRTMAIGRTSVLTGHVLASVLRTLIADAVIIGAGLLLGFRPRAGVLGWLAVIGLLTLVSFAFSWLAVAPALLAKSAEAVQGMVMPAYILPYLSTAFVPAETMPGAVRWFVGHQPLSPVIDTMRGLWLGSPVGNQPYWAVGWCLLLAAVGWVWARLVYNRR